MWQRIQSVCSLVCDSEDVLRLPQAALPLSLTTLTGRIKPNPRLDYPPLEIIVSLGLVAMCLCVSLCVCVWGGGVCLCTYLCVCVGFCFCVCVSACVSSQRRQGTRRSVGREPGSQRTRW